MSDYRASASSHLYGAVDLGTNTCRLLISKSSQGERGITFSHVDSLSRVVRFGEGLDQTKMLSVQSMDRAFMALEECQRKLDYYRVPHMRCVATAACRYAKNTEAFLAEAQRRTGIRVEVITPQEESELSVAGCAELFDAKFEYVVVFDIGGGSTELVWCKILPEHNFKIIDSISFPYGFATLKEQLQDPETKEQISQFFSYETNEFAIRHGILPLIKAGKVQMIGASGTITTLAAIALNLDSYDKARVHETLLYKQDLDNVIRYLHSTRYADRLQHPCIGQQRAESILGGVALFKAIYDILTVEPIMTADRGVREGILHTLAKQYPPEGM